MFVLNLQKLSTFFSALFCFIAADTPQCFDVHYNACYRPLRRKNIFNCSYPLLLTFCSCNNTVIKNNSVRSPPICLLSLSPSLPDCLSPYNALTLSLLPHSFPEQHTELDNVSFNSQHRLISLHTSSERMLSRGV